MKKSIALVLAILIAVSTIFVACSADTDKDKKTTSSGTGGLDDNAEDYIMGFVDVTDKDGKKVTDKSGNTVTSQVFYHKEESGGTTANYLIDDDGNAVTDDEGNKVTIKTPSTTLTTTTTKSSTTVTTTTMKQNNESTTEPELTTIKSSNDKVPLTSDSGPSVQFSSDDQQIIKSMLEVPYLYNASYENEEGVPINIAAHVAIWMAEREGLNTNTFASGTIVLDLFIYFGQTVVNFPKKCNDGKDKTSDITYNSNNDTFSIPNFEEKKQTVSLEKIEDLGNNNYYKVVAKVRDAGSITKVIAIVQRNRLNKDYGFSIKALKWS